MGHARGRRDRADFFIRFIPPTSLYFYIRLAAARTFGDFTRRVRRIVTAQAGSREMCRQEVRDV